MSAMSEILLKASNALRFRDEVKPNAWAEANRYLPPSMTNNPGMWDASLTPYLIGIVDALVEPGVEKIVVLKAVQIGYSEGVLRNGMAYTIECDPGPTLLVMPSEDAAVNTLSERVYPMLENTECLRRHMYFTNKDGEEKRDIKKNLRNKIHLDNMDIYTAWSGSAQSLAERPIRWLWMDEVDKYSTLAGKEANPIKLAEERTTTFKKRARKVIGSTCTDLDGNIWKEWQGCTQQRQFIIPCKNCGEFNRPSWDDIIYPENRNNLEPKQFGDMIIQEKLARYKCPHCGFEHTDAQKLAQVRHGHWHDTIEGGSNRVVGFQPTSLLSPFVSIDSLVNAWVQCNTPKDYVTFFTQKLAKPYEKEVGRLASSIFEDKVKLAGPPMEVPVWAEHLVATCDVQADRLYFVVRAWGSEGQSKLVRYGEVQNFDQLKQRLVDESYPRERTGEACKVTAIWIDSNYRTDEVYKFCVANRGDGLWQLCTPIKGSGNQSKEFVLSKVTGHRFKNGEVLQRGSLNSHYYEDMLNNFIHDDDDMLWQVHNKIGEDYIKHLRSKRKELDIKTDKMVWKNVHKRDDIRDCEVYQTAWAGEAGLLGNIS